ncbi:hypothetical protein GOV13_04045 [Candidatus Pacearchaeota archaeon]|nr:hypothetical protein [Candidatus Pacearchaeota archaeon]
MTLRFCHKCKTLQRPRKKDGKIIFDCSKCGFSEVIDEKDHVITSEKMKKPEKRGKGSVEDKDVFATYEHVCEKCGYDKAEVIDMGIFYSDEDNLILLKCGKCGWSERIGRKVS